MKALLKLALFLAFCSPIFGQTSNVQATIVDGDGTPWVSGTYTITLIPSQAGTPTRVDNGQNVSPTAFNGTLDGTGSLSVTLVSASNILPKGSTWQFRICPNVFSATCGTTNIAVNASGSYSSQLNAVITAPRISGGLGAYAYADVEVASTTNNSYWNVTSSTCRYYGASWGACGGSGGGPPTGAAGGVLNGTYPNPGLVAPVAVNSAVSSATLGSELTTNGGFSGSLSGWTDSGSNWSYGPGALHTAGAADTLSQTITVTSGQTYQIIFNLSGVSAGSLAVAIGGVPVYLDGNSTAFAATGIYNRSFVAGASGSLVFTPTSSFAGTIASVSVKQVTLASVTPSFEALNSDGSLGVPFYSGGIGLQNIFIGQGVGTSNTVGNGNFAAGYNAFSANITGYYDVAVGLNALQSNTVGYQDVAVGTGALASNTSGAGNAAFGYLALNLNTLGFDNDAFGEFALQNNTTGSGNDAYGQSALLSNTTGSDSVALGQFAGHSQTTGSSNTYLGYLSGYTANSANANVTGGEDTWVGYGSGPNTATQLSNASCLGYTCSNSANNQVSLGNTSVTSVVTSGAITDTSTSASVFSGPLASPAYTMQTGAAGNSAPFFDDYYAAGTYNTAGGVLGSASGGDGCSGVNSTYLDVNHPGNLVITSGTGGSGTGYYCGPNSGVASLISINSSTPWTYETVVLIPVLPGTTAGTYQAGMAHTLAASPWTASNGMFYLSSANGVPNDWYCGTGSSSLSFTDSTVAAVASTWTRLTITSDGTLVRWYINGVEVCGTGTAMPTGLSMFPTGYTVVAGSASSVVMAVDYAYFYRALAR